MTNFSMITEKSNKHNNFSRTDGLGVTPSVAKKGKSREEGLVLGRTFFNIPGTGGHELVGRES